MVNILRTTRLLPKYPNLARKRIENYVFLIHVTVTVILANKHLIREKFLYSFNLYPALRMLDWLSYHDKSATFDQTLVYTFKTYTSVEM